MLWLFKQVHQFNQILRYRQLSSLNVGTSCLLWVASVKWAWLVSSSQAKMLLIGGHNRSSKWKKQNGKWVFTLSLPNTLISFGQTGTMFNCFVHPLRDIKVTCRLFRQAYLCPGKICDQSSAQYMWWRHRPKLWDGTTYYLKFYCIAWVISW